MIRMNWCGQGASSGSRSGLDAECGTVVRAGGRPLVTHITNPGYRIFGSRIVPGVCAASHVGSFENIDVVSAPSPELRCTPTCTPGSPPSTHPGRSPPLQSPNCTTKWSDPIMRTPRTRRLMSGIAGAAAVALVAVGCSGGSSEAGADDDAIQACNDINHDYTSGTMEMIVPWAAGGGTDGVARLIGDQLSNQIGTNVNVVNRTGGSGVVGHQAMVDADPDGQTIGLVTVEIGMMHHQGLTDISGEDLTAISQKIGRASCRDR